MHLLSHALRTIVIAVVATTYLAVAGRAHSEPVVVDDPAEASRSISDLRSVAANLETAQLSVKVTFTDLEPVSEGGTSSLSVFVDTEDSTPGPEFRLDTGLQEGSDYQLARMTDWRPVGCGHSVVLDFAANVATIHIGRACLGNPEELRVGVRMTDLYDASRPVIDWMKKPRGWTPWLVAG